MKISRIGMRGYGVKMEIGRRRECMRMERKWGKGKVWGRRLWMNVVSIVK